MKRLTIFMLDAFCQMNSISYAVTGTMALQMLGVPSKYGPGDIDLKVFDLTPEQKVKLHELQELGGLDETNYHDEACFTIAVNGEKVNLMQSDAKAVDYIPVNCVKIRLTEKIGYNTEREHIIPVQLVAQAWADKFKLNRRKDKDYAADLINTISNLSCSTQK